MGYRDEREQLRARVETLEGELAEAQDTIARLTGVQVQPTSDSKEERSAFMNAPRSVAIRRELDFEVTEQGLEAIAALLRERANATVQQVGRSLTAGGFSLVQRDGRTVIEMKRDFSSATLATLGSSFLAGGFVSMATFALFHDLVMRSVSESNALWVIPLGVALAIPVFRTIFQKQSRRGARELRGTFEAVVELAKRYRVADGPKLRVDAKADAENGPTEAVEVPADVGSAETIR